MKSLVTSDKNVRTETAQCCAKISTIVAGCHD
jgi:hypothetical protein